jgi:hypothetical protein
LIRSSTLTSADVLRLFAAMSFAQWRFGQRGIMNVHVVVAWRTLGIADHQCAVHLLTVVLNESQKWARKGTPGLPPRRRRARTGAGFVLRYVWTCEHSPAHGFIAHVLCAVPPGAVPAFRAWLETAVLRLAEHGGERGTVKVVSSQGSVFRGWAWFRHLTRQLDPEARSLRAVLRLKPPRPTSPVTCVRLANASRELLPRAQTVAGFRSALRRGDPQRIDADLYDGQELTAWQERLAAQERARAQAIDARPSSRPQFQTDKHPVFEPSQFRPISTSFLGHTVLES